MVADVIQQMGGARCFEFRFKPKQRARTRRQQTGRTAKMSANTARLLSTLLVYIHRTETRLVKRNTYEMKKGASHGATSRCVEREAATT